ncbi:hypothetical protein [Streptomyces sp. NPDC055006]
MLDGQLSVEAECQGLGKNRWRRPDASCSIWVRQLNPSAGTSNNTCGGSAPAYRKTVDNVGRPQILPQDGTRCRV